MRRYGKNPTAFINTTNSKWLWNLLHQTSKSSNLSHWKIKPTEHDIRFVDDNWETHQLVFSWSWLGSLADGMEITSSPYSNKLVDWATVPVTSGGHLRFGTFGFLHPRSRFCFHDIEWAPGVRNTEKSSFKLSHEHPKIQLLKRFWPRHASWKLRKFEKEADVLWNWVLFNSAYDYVLKCSLLLNFVRCSWSSIRYRTLLHCPHP